MNLQTLQKLNPWKKTEPVDKSKKIEEIERIFPSDVDAIKYMLGIKFEKEYRPKKEEFYFIEKNSKSEERLLVDMQIRPYQGFLY